jgi:hypothetical protein
MKSKDVRRGGETVERGESWWKGNYTGKGVGVGFAVWMYSFIFKYFSN